MKRNLHPETRPVIFRDMKTGHEFLIESTVETAEKKIWSDGKEYPVVAVEVSSSSHPAYAPDAGVEQTPSSRAQTFNRKYSNKTAH